MAHNIERVFIMETTDKKYKFLIQYEEFNVTSKRHPFEYPVTYDEDDTKLKCTLEQAIQYTRKRTDGEEYMLALIMSYHPQDYSYYDDIVDVSTIPLYFEKTADKLRLDIRKQEDFNYLKEKYKRIYNFVTEIYDMFSTRVMEEFIDELEFEDDKTTIEFDNTEFFVCKGKFTSYTDAEQVKIIHNLQKRVSEATGVKGLEDFEPRVYKYARWEECLFDYDENDPLHCDDNEIEL